MLGAQTKFTLNGDDKGVESAGVNLKSYLKFSGNALPKVPVYVEVALAEQDSFENLYKKDTTEIKDGALNMLVDTVFDPVYYYGGQASAATYLGHFKGGVETPFVNWTTGYKYAKLPPHTNVNWTTVDKEWEAGYNSTGGYNQFDFTPAFNFIPFLADNGIQIEAVAVPNRTADRAGSRYGFIGYVDGKFSTGSLNHYVDFQYNGAYGTEFDKIFDTIYEADLIAGYSLVAPFDFGAITFKGNFLLNGYGSTDNGDGTKSYYKPGSSDVGNVSDEYGLALANMAANANVTFANDTITAVLGGRFRGIQANMMYVEEGADDHTNISDQLGVLNHWQAWANVNAKLNYESILVGVKPAVRMTLDKEQKSPFTDKDNIRVYVHPYASVDFDEMIGFPAAIEFTADLRIDTKEDDYSTLFGKSSMVGFPAASLKYSMSFDSDMIKKLDVVYAFDNTDGNYLWNTLTAVADTGFGWTLQAGAGLRSLIGSTADDTYSPFGAFVGGFTKLPVLAKPTAYVQGMYGMDPYNAFGDGPTAFNLSGDYDNLFDGGVSDYANNAAVRVGLQWDL